MNEQEYLVDAIPKKLQSCSHFKCLFFPWKKRKKISIKIYLLVKMRNDHEQIIDNLGNQS